ncbi:MAG: DUF3883 domain-containing protein, partial [Proteobacteria bacterium]|nr:DUF3883 domain-containing protein [Pseudomonadota bacterium]
TGCFKAKESAAPSQNNGVDAQARSHIEQLAMDAVAAAERSMGFNPRDVSGEKCGWDITSQQPPQGDKLPDDRLIEVKGRAKGATTITLTKNEIIAALNKPDQFWLAIVLVNDDDSTEGPYYLQGPVSQAPDWAEVSKNLELSELLGRATRFGSAA